MFYVAPDHLKRKSFIAMNNLTYFLDQPGGIFTAATGLIPEPGPGEIRLRTLKTSV